MCRGTVVKYFSSIRCIHLKRKICIYFSMFLVFLMQLLISQILLSYGIFLLEFIVVKKTENFLTGLWVSITFLAVTKLTKPVIKPLLKYNHQQKYRKVLIYSSVGVFASYLMASLNCSLLNQIITIGILGGVLIGAISVNLEYKCKNVFKKSPKLYQKMFLLSETITLMIFPKLIYFLNNAYNSLQGQRLIGAILLILIPLGLLIKTPKKKPVVKHTFTYHRNLGSENDELSIKSSVQNEHSDNEIDSSDDEDIDSKDDEDGGKNNEEDFSYHEEVNTNRAFKLSNEHILKSHRLSKILEEDDEVVEVDEDVKKKTNRISAIIRAEALKLNENNFNIDQDEAASRKNVEINSDAAKLTKKWANIHLEQTNSTGFNVRKLIDRCFRSFKSIYFYPVLISACIMTIIPNVYLFLVPFTNLLDTSNEFVLIETQNAVEALYYIGNCLALVRIISLLMEHKLPGVALKVIFLSTNLFLSLSLLNMKHRNQKSHLINFLIQYGFCSCLEKRVYEEFVGKSKWKRLKEPVEFFSAFFVVLVYSIIYFKMEIYSFFNISGVVLILNCILWLIFFIIKWIVMSCKNYRHYVINHDYLETNNI